MSDEFSKHELERCACSHTRMGHIQGFGACLHFLSAKHGSECDCKQFRLVTDECPDCHHDAHKAAQCRRCNCGISEISHPTQNAGKADTKLEYVHIGGRQWWVNRGHRVKPCKRAEDLDK